MSTNLPKGLSEMLKGIPESSKGSIVVAQRCNDQGEPVGAPFQRYVWTKHGDRPMRLTTCWAPSVPTNARVQSGRGKFEKQKFLVFRTDAQWVSRGEGDRQTYVCFPPNPNACDQTEWLWGKSWQEEVSRTWQYIIIDRKSGEEKVLTFCRSRWFGRSVQLYNGLGQGDEMYVSPGYLLVCHGHAQRATADQMEDLGIELLGEGELIVSEDDPLYVMLGGQVKHVVEILGFVQWQPESPPSVEEIRQRHDRAYLTACGGLRPATEDLIRDGKLNLTPEEVEERDLEAQRQIAALAEARDKLIAYSGTKELHAPTAASQLQRPKNWREIIEQAALSRSKPRRKPKESKQEGKFRPGENITAATVVDNIKNARKHSLASAKTKQQLADALVKAKLTNAFRMGRLTYNTLREALANKAGYTCDQGLTQAILDTVKQLTEAEETERVKPELATPAGETEL